MYLQHVLYFSVIVTNRIKLILILGVFGIVTLNPVINKLETLLF
ncbi:MAG: hypothetical protein ACI95C_001981, partial [Pseudohongiellaceae bacterium]